MVHFLHGQVGRTKQKDGTPKNMDKKPIKSHMNDLCDQAGCSEKQKINHAWKWERNRWHSHPQAAFVAWWKPFEFDPVSEASVGGHPDAKRIWARKTQNGWIRREYGVPTLDAWNTANYVAEFATWQDLGSPEKEPFISIAASDLKQSEFWHDIAPLLHAVGKPLKEKKALVKHFNFDPLVEELFAKYKVNKEPLPDWEKAVTDTPSKTFKKSLNKTLSRIL
jgi:hypothetical protein